MCFPSGRPRGVEQALLREQHERPLGDPAAPGLPLRRDDLREASPPRCTVAGLRALGRPPRDRPVERPVELEHAGPVAEPLEPAPVARRQPVAGEGDELLRRHVEQHPVGAVELVERDDPAPRLDLAAERPEVRGERVRDRAGSRRAANGQPARVREQPEARARTRPTASASAAASSAPRARRTARAPARRETSCARPRSPGAPSGAEKRANAAGCAGRPSGASRSSRDLLPASGERAHQPPVPAGVGAERGRRLVDRADEQRRGPVVERMRERGRRLDPLDAVLLERHRAQERRGDRERVDRRAHVVDEPGQRQLGRPATSADRRPRPRPRAPPDPRGRARSPRRDRSGPTRRRSHPAPRGRSSGRSRRRAARRASRALPRARGTREPEHRGDRPGEPSARPGRRDAQPDQGGDHRREHPPGVGPREAGDDRDHRQDEEDRSAARRAPGARDAEAARSRAEQP